MIKLLVSDIDGVWTDGGMYYFNNKEEGKKFNVRDGVGALLLKSAGIPWGIITGEQSKLLENRAKKLKCEILLMNVKNKKLIFLTVNIFVRIKFLIFKDFLNGFSMY